MKVLIFSTAYFPHVGGAEVAVKEITNRIGDVDFDMITIRLDKKDAKHEKNFGNIKNIYRIGWGLGKIDKLLFPFRASRFAQKLHKQEKYDMIWSIMASFSGFASLFFKKKNSDVKFSLTLQEGDDLNEIENKVNYPFVKKWFREIFIEADYIQVISKYLADWARGMGATAKIDIVRNGMDFKQVNEDEKEKLKIKLNIKNEKVVLTTSRLVKKNGIEDLIKAVAELPVKLIICGDGELKNELKQLTKDLKIEDKIIFTGFIQPDKLFSYYAIADIFCRPSISEGLGNSFLEAMGAGVPIIGTPVGGIPDFLKDSETGWFCNVKDPESITEKVKYILNPENKEKVDIVKIQAKNSLKSFYNWQVIAIQMKNIFNKLIN